MVATVVLNIAPFSTVNVSLRVTGTSNEFAGKAPPLILLDGILLSLKEASNMP